jgi:ankyrin repeat protein
LDYIKQNYTKDKTKKILNHKNFTSKTPLMLAIESSMTNVVKLLLGTKLIDINNVDHEGKTSLLYSIENDLSDIVELLLSNKDINVNIADNYGNTPIIRAIELGDNKLIFSLLTKMAELNTVDSTGRSPLIHALLLKYNRPKIIARNNFNNYEDFGFVGSTCGDFSRCFKDQNFIGNNGPEMFAKKNKLDVNMKDLYDVIVSKLIKYPDTDVNVSDIQGRTPMTLICNNEDVFLFNTLLSSPKYNPHVKNVKGISDYEFIRHKYETLSCNLFGSDRYCPLKCCTKHKKIDREKIKEETQIIKDIAKEIDGLSEDSDSLVDNCTDFEIGHELSMNDNIPTTEKCNLHGVSKSVALEDYFVTDCPQLYDMGYSDIPNYSMSSVEITRHVSEIDIKKFSVLKYFYEKMTSLTESKEVIS